MISELDNPFSVTKATEFSDLEINAYWVNFNTKEDISIEMLLNPREFMPKYLIGGKGCGKTHILRYFSFPLQQIRNENDIHKILSNDKYIGLYSVFSGLNSSRFTGKGISDAEWNSVFEYYFELYICDSLLHTLEVVFNLLDYGSAEEKIIQSILSIFNNYKEISGVKTFSSLIGFLSELRRKIDSQVLNAAFTRKLDFDEVKILFAPGDLLFGIPRHISNSNETFKDVKFIYIFDEYEKLFEWQKKFVNSLVWDKKKPVTFWIGARRYGYTTRETRTGEIMKSGSEFQDISLDVIIRRNELFYKQFATKLYTNRLMKYYEFRRLKVNEKDVNKSFYERFVPYDENKILAEIKDKNKNKEYKHLRDLREKLSLGIKSGMALNLNRDTNLDEIIEAITLNTDNDPLEQKYKLFYLYQIWKQAKKKDTFEELLGVINSEYKKYKAGIQSEFLDIIEKRKKDFIAQLTKENNVLNTEYSGINEFIRISQGNPRSLIIILKKAIEFAKIRGEKPLEEGGSISLDSQYLAVYDTARWFYEDAELVGESGKNMYVALRRLTEYFILERFCDKPVETTISCFYIKCEELSDKSLLCIETMKMHSILIEDTDGRIEKNSGRKERLFQINKVLAPLWNLPTVVRGNLSLSKEVAESIFNPEQNAQFEQYLKIRKSQLNAPEFGRSSNMEEQSNTLFQV